MESSGVNREQPGANPECDAKKESPAAQREHYGAISEMADADRERVNAEMESHAEMKQINAELEFAVACRE